MPIQVQPLLYQPNAFPRAARMCALEVLAMISRIRHLHSLVKVIIWSRGSLRKHAIARGTIDFDYSFIRPAALPLRLARIRKLRIWATGHWSNLLFRNQ